MITIRKLFHGIYMVMLEKCDEKLMEINEIEIYFLRVH